MSTPATRSQSKPTALLALVTSFLVAMGGMLVLPTAANAAGAVVTPSVVSAVPQTSVTIDVAAAGLPGDVTAVYGALIVKGAEAGVDAQGGYQAFADPFPAVSGGATSFSLTALANDLVRDTQYEVLVWKQHSAPIAETIYGRADVVIDWDALFPPVPVPAESTTTSVQASATSVVEGTGISLTATVAPAAATGTVTFLNGQDPVSAATPVSNGQAVASNVQLAAGEHNLSAVFTSSDQNAFLNSTGNGMTVTVTAAAKPATKPAVEIVGSVTGLDPEAETVVTVKGSGFLPDAPATSGAQRPPLNGKFAGTYVIFGSFAAEWQPSKGAPGSARVVVDQKWAVPAESLATIGGAPAGAVLLNEDGTFETTLTLTPNEAKAVAGGSWGIATYPGGGAKYAPFETFTPVTFAAPSQDPAVEIVGSVTGLDPEAETVVTVKGSGFLPDAPATSGAQRPPLNGKFAGTYVIFGSFAAEWQPSKGAPGSARVVVDQKWAVPAESLATIGGAPAGAVLLNEDGTFETTLTLKSNEAKAVAGGSWGIATYPGGGAKYAPFETFTPVTFEKPATAKVSGTVSKVSAGTSLSIAVAGAGFTETTGYVALIERGTEATVGANSGYVAFAQPFPAITAGVLKTTLVAEKAKLDRTKKYEVLVWKQHSIPSSDTILARSDVTISDAQWDQLLVTKPSPKPTPPAVTPSAPKQPGSLTWGISSTFGNYVTGDIAKGSITTIGAGGGAGGYVFPQSSASGWDAASQTGSVQFSGTVRYSGHHGALGLSIVNPMIRVTGPASAQLFANGQLFANLNLGAASRTVAADGAVTWRGVPVAPAGAGGSFFSFGEHAMAMDSLSFTVGAVNPSIAGSTTVVSPAALKANRQAAAVAPATTGIRIITPLADIVAGGEIEFEADGFEPGERGTLVALYAEAGSAAAEDAAPTMLDRNAGADANGVVRWIGALPKDVLGAYTLTLQGSIDAGATIDIAAASAKAKAEMRAAASDEQAVATLAFPGSVKDGRVELWWMAAGALVLVAGGLVGAVIARRRAALSASALGQTTGAAL